MNEAELNPEIEQELHEIKDNSQRARTLIIVFWTLIGATLLGLGTGYNELQLLWNVQAGKYVSEQEANISDMIQMTMGFVQAGIYIASMVVFLNWFRRAYGNLHRVGVNIKHYEKMAVWAWMIPFIWFYRPVQIMNEIWTKTQEKIKEFDETYEIQSGGIIIGLWWTIFIISNFIGRYIFKTLFKQESIGQMIESSQATMISDIIQIPEALLVILIVYRLSKMESKLAYEVEKSGGNIEYAK
jgi:heme/copper-type cytochrome/quinol oxidase subunit 2